MATQDTVRPTQPGRRVVRRGCPALDVAYETALFELPAELRPAIIAYVDAKRAEYEARSALSTAMTHHGLRWRTVDEIARRLAYGTA